MLIFDFTLGAMNVYVLATKCFNDLVAEDTFNII